MRYAFLNNEKGCQKKKRGREQLVTVQMAQYQSSASQSKNMTLGTAAVHMLAVGPSDAATTGALCQCWYTIPEHLYSRARE